MKQRLVTLIILAAFPLSLAAQEPAGNGNASKDQEKKQGEEPEGKVRKSDQEWAKVLTRAQFQVTRMKMTEPAFSGKYVHTKVKGTFTCVCCGAKLFSSKNKFESGTGWPSFWRPYAMQSLEQAPDYSAAEPRVEVNCSRCGAHLGHVFNDGPPPTGLRYCINSLALKLVPDSAPASKKKTKDAAKAKDEDKPQSDAAASKGDTEAQSEDDAPRPDPKPKSAPPKKSRSRR